MSRSLTALLVTVLALGMWPAAAPADGDPASDVLLGQSVFYPYQPPVSASIQKTLDAAPAAAQRAHFPIKVALIASPVDLGVIPDLFGQPQKYAAFLDQEISFQTRQPLLVVMSSGYGAVGLPSAAQSAVGSLSNPSGKQSNDLAKAAITAVARLATAAGHPIQGVPGVGGASDSGGASATTVIVIVLVVSAVLTAAALVATTVRRRRTTPLS